MSDVADDVLIDEASLAENTERALLHPVDQYRAFQAMRQKGVTEAAIAAALLLDFKVLAPRLVLMSVAPALLEMYAEDGKPLQQPLVTIIVLTVMVLDIDVRNVGDMGALPDTLPVFLLPDVTLNLETLAI